MEEAKCSNCKFCKFGLDGYYCECDKSEVDPNDYCPNHETFWKKPEYLTHITDNGY